MNEHDWQPHVACGLLTCFFVLEILGCVVVPQVWVNFEKCVCFLPKGSKMGEFGESFREFREFSAEKNLAERFQQAVFGFFCWAKA